jgi:hypothetical protein
MEKVYQYLERVELGRSTPVAMITFVDVSRGLVICVKPDGATQFNITKFVLGNFTCKKVFY